MAKRQCDKRIASIFHQALAPIVINWMFVNHTENDFIFTALVYEIWPVFFSPADFCLRLSIYGEIQSKWDQFEEVSLRKNQDFYTESKINIIETFNEKKIALPKIVTLIVRSDPHPQAREIIFKNCPKATLMIIIRFPNKMPITLNRFPNESFPPLLWLLAGCLTKTSMSCNVKIPQYKNVFSCQDETKKSTTFFAEWQTGLKVDMGQE